MSETKLPPVNVFKEVEVFRAGTFKFEKNKDYIDNEVEIEKKSPHPWPAMHNCFDFESWLFGSDPFGGNLLDTPEADTKS